MGVSFQQKYESGANRLSASKLWLASQALEVPVADLYRGLLAESPASTADEEVGRLLNLLPVRSRRLVLEFARSLKASGSTDS